MARKFVADALQEWLIEAGYQTNSDLSGHRGERYNERFNGTLRSKS
jgi:hypothetical protein